MKTEYSRPKKEYSAPELIEYGKVEQLTLGSQGPDWDINISLNPLAISISNCTSSSWQPVCVNVSS